MYLNTGYLNHSHMDFKDKSCPLIVGSCGTYRLSRHPKLPTYRPRGRLYCTDRKNFRNMNITEKIRQKYTGFTSQEAM